ncbi:AI-2E family transporter [Halorussus gelatinilyticus]|uniref:AI-2E family transporter n=1 Tax=Halorussus gelatinilyticus TaxID=2937524 RepID=A0A8U0IME6_9EURY|nr:AI-2E family transporter [Halorussus gelatinilyticus]UPW01592.1 AI-2E family transporter [Halorussus gelatinilyticus]
MKARTAFATVLVGVLAVLSLLVIRPFLDYVLGAMLLAFVLTPLQRRLAPEVGARVSAFALVSLTILLFVGPIGLFVRVVFDGVGELPTEVSDLPTYQSVERVVERVVGVQIGARFDQILGNFTSTLAERSSGLASAGVHFTLGVLLLLFLLYYLLKDGDVLIRWAKGVTPLPRKVQDDLYAEAEEATWAVLKGHVFVATVQGFVSGLGLIALGLPNAAFWTVVMMFLAMVPIVGVSPVLGGATIYLVVNGRLLEAALLVVYGITVVAVTDDYLRALVIDKESSLHSGVVLLGVFGAAYFLGAIGIFVGPIILALFKETVEVFNEYYDLA